MFLNVFYCKTRVKKQYFICLVDKVQVIDIIKNKRFYASPFDKLNDPMEGIFEYYSDTSKAYIESLKDTKKEYQARRFLLFILSALLIKKEM